MQLRLDTRLAVTLASIIAFAAVACSAAPAPTGENSSSKPKTPPKAATDDPDTTPTPSTPTPTTPTPTAGECGKKADGEACFECCYQKAPAEYDKAEEVFYACICEAPGACKADCADSICGTDETKQPSAACEACMQTNGTSCGEKADAACELSAACKSVNTCADTECAKFDKP